MINILGVFILFMTVLGGLLEFKESRYKKPLELIIDIMFTAICYAILSTGLCAFLISIVFLISYKG